MINCIAIDDEPKALEVIERYCQKIDLICLKATYREPVKAIEFLSHEKIDLIFLDINMPEINGVQLIATLADKPMVIFTTAYSQYAVESYNLNAIDYLLKPITFERFLASVNKARNLFLIKNNPAAKSETPETVFIKSGPQTYQVKISDILYLEKDGNYITVYLKDKKILIRENMNDIFTLIPPGEFVRVHKSFVVAVKHITMIEVHQLIINGEKIPVGNTYREGLRLRLGLDA
jgi:two-component system LytT family response regulator